MPTLRSKTLNISMLENDDTREFTFPEIFGNTTPDFAIVQSCGNRRDKSEPDVGRESVRFSNGYVTPSQQFVVGNMADVVGSAHFHSEDFSYINLPAPNSDDSSGTTRQSRGTVEIIQNGVRITNDSAYSKRICTCCAYKV